MKYEKKTTGGVLKGHRSQIKELPNDIWEIICRQMIQMDRLQIDRDRGDIDIDDIDDIDRYRYRYTIALQLKYKIYICKSVFM